MLIVHESDTHAGEEDLPDHIDASMERILIEMEFHAVMQDFGEVQASKAFQCIDQGFPFMIPEAFH